MALNLGFRMPSGSQTREVEGECHSSQRKAGSSASAFPKMTGVVPDLFLGSGPTLVSPHHREVVVIPPGVLIPKLGNPLGVMGSQALL